MSIIGEHLRDDCMQDAYGPNPCMDDSITILILRRENEQLKHKISRLEKRISDDGWRLNPDRMGGAFSEDEIRNANTWK